MVTFVAVPCQLYSLTGSPLQVGLLSLCDAIPLLLFSAVIVLRGLAIAGFGLATVLWLGLAMLAAAGRASVRGAGGRGARRRAVVGLGHARSPAGRCGRGGESWSADVAVLVREASLRLSIVSGGVACAVGAVAIVAAIPSLLHYDSKAHVSEDPVPERVPETDG